MSCVVSLERTFTLVPLALLTMISPHGKGHWSDVRIIMKQTLRIKQIQPNLMQLHNATNVVAYSKDHMGRQHLTYDGARRGVHCCFYEVKIDDVNKVDQFNVQ